MYATGTAGGNALAQVTIPNASTIKGVQYTCGWSAAIDADDIITFELSLASAAQIGVNGSPSPFALMMIPFTLTTSGTSVPAVTGFMPVNQPVVQGQIVYLHASQVASETWVFNGILWY